MKNYKDWNAFVSSHKSMPNLIIILIILFSTFTSLLICSKNSFLYPFNDWYDANLMFTVGKGLMSGKTLYVDLTDQKGPYCFLFYGVAYLISHKNFIGLFIIEFISLTAFLLVIRKIVNLYSDTEYPFLYTVFAFSITSSGAFVHGGSIEELSLPLLALALYYTLKTCRLNSLPQKDVLVAGIMSGILFWMKFTICGIYFGWIIVLTITLLKRKHIKGFFVSALVYFCGCMIATVPWVIYFITRKALPDFLNTYLYTNIFDYQNETSLLGERVMAILRTMGEFYFKKGNLALSVVLLAGIILFLAQREIMAWEKISVILLFLLTNLGVFFKGKAFPYYGLIICVFYAITAVSVTVLVNKRIGPKRFLSLKWPALVTFAGGIALSLAIGDNVYMMKFHQKDLPQFRFASIINQSDDKSLLNYKFLDGGVYTVLGTLPTMKEYCTYNVNYYDWVEKQKVYLEKAETNYVVTFYEFPVSEDEIYIAFPEVDEHYYIVDSMQHFIENWYPTFTLWKRDESF